MMQRATAIKRRCDGVRAGARRHQSSELPAGLIWEGPSGAHGPLVRAVGVTYACHGAHANLCYRTGGRQPPGRSGGGWRHKAYRVPGFLLKFLSPSLLVLWDAFR